MTGHDNPFIKVLQELNSHALFDLSERMSECVERANDTGKMATMTLTLKFKPQGQGRMEVEDQIKQNMPEFPRATTLLFTAEDGLLQKDDPKQTKLSLRTVDTQTTKLKEVK